MAKDPDRLPEPIDKNEIELGGMTLKSVVLDNGERVYEPGTLRKFTNMVLAPDFRCTEDEAKLIVKFIEKFL